VPRLLAQSGQIVLRSEDLVLLLVLALLATVAFVLYASWRRERAHRALIEHQAAVIDKQAEGAGSHAEHEQQMFEQHQRLNELQGRKLHLELRLMEAQLRLMEADLSKRDEAGQVHAAMLLKTRLEVDSLKLHISEQRKRLDDYGQYSE
jgi:hypothetical protein